MPDNRVQLAKVGNRDAKDCISLFLRNDSSHCLFLPRFGSLINDLTNPLYQAVGGSSKMDHEVFGGEESSVLPEVN